MDIDGKLYCPRCMRELEAEGACPHCGYAPGSDRPAAALEQGTLLNGRYQLGEAIGQGGFGITYAAWDEILGMPVAVKEYFPQDCATRNPEYTDDVEPLESSRAVYLDGLRRFQRESHLLAELQGIPSVVKVLDFFAENNTAYIAMEYVRGVPVDQWVRENRLKPAQVLSLLRPAVDALVATHRQGVLHRDLTPGNMLVEPDGRVKLIDFGSATEVERSGGTVVLTRRYAPVEQYGREHGAQGPWTDVYGISAVLYALVTGAEPQESVLRIYDDKLAPPRRRGAALRRRESAAIMDGLAVNPEKRIQSMEEFRARLYGLPMPEQIRRHRRAMRRLGIAAAVVFAIAAVLAANFSVGLPLGQGLLFALRGDGWHVVGQTRQRETRAVPESRLGIPVIQVDAGAFRNDDTLRALSVPGSVRTLGDAAFYDCDALEIVSLAEGVEVLGVGCFADCDSLAEITLPQSLAEAPEDVFNGASDRMLVWGSRDSNAAYIAWQWELDFADPEELAFEPTDGGLMLVCVESAAERLVLPSRVNGTPVVAIGPDVRVPTARELVLPEALTEIPAQLCMENEELKSVIMGDSVTRIGDSAFEDCDHLVDVRWPAALERVGDRAFAECYRLSGVTFPEGMRAVGEQAFYFCHDIPEADMPDSLTELGKECFSGCWSLTRVRLSERLTVLPDGALSYTGLTSLRLPESLEIIDGSFAGSELEYLLIPEGVHTLGYGTFYNCEKLRYLQFMNDDVSFEGDPYQQLWLCPAELVLGGREGSAAQRLAKATGHGFEDIESWTEGFTLRGEEAAFDYRMEGAVRVPWFNAEENCPIRETSFCGSHVTEVTLPLFQEQIHSSEFYVCKSLERVTAAGRIRDIFSNGFENCPALTEVPVADGLETLGDHAFYSCPALTEVLLPDTVTKLGDYAFYFCAGLERVRLSNGLRVLPWHCLSYIAITELTVPGSVVVVQMNAVDNCRQLRSVILEEGVLRVESYAFNELPALRTVDLPASLVNLDGRALEACDALTDVWVRNPDTRFEYWQGRPAINGGSPVIHGYPGSTAEAYAAEHGLAFEPIVD